MLALLFLTVIVFIMTVRATLVLLGAYKDPLLASFEGYGEETFSSPLFSMIIWASIFLYLLLYWYFPASFVFGIGLIITIPLLGLYSFIKDIIIRYKNLFSKHPRWFHELIEMTDRDERRRIAYMWLFLPPSTRMIYNANNYLFHQWVEQVLLTVASSTSPRVTDIYKA